MKTHELRMKSGAWEYQESPSGDWRKCPCHRCAYLRHKIICSESPCSIYAGVIRLTDPASLTPKQAEAKAKLLIISGYAFPCLWYYNKLLTRLDSNALAQLEKVWHKDHKD